MSINNNEFEPTADSGETLKRVGLLVGEIALKYSELADAIVGFAEKQKADYALIRKIREEA